MGQMFIACAASLFILLVQPHVCLSQDKPAAGKGVEGSTPPAGGDAAGSTATPLKKSGPAPRKVHPPARSLSDIWQKGSGITLAGSVVSFAGMGALMLSIVFYRLAGSFEFVNNTGFDASAFASLALLGTSIACTSIGVSLLMWGTRFRSALASGAGVRFGTNPLKIGEALFILSQLGYIVGLFCMFSVNEGVFWGLYGGAALGSLSAIFYIAFDIMLTERVRDFDKKKKAFFPLPVYAYDHTSRTHMLSAVWTF